MTDRRRRRHRFVAFALATLVLGSCAGPVEESQADPIEDGWAFKYRERGDGQGSALDLRKLLNENVAGQSGFVKRTTDGNGFALGDGSPVRFWAVGSSVFESSPETIPQHVRFLARMGVNLVRLHAQIAPKGAESKLEEVDEKEIDGIWRFVAEAKKQGIYVTISPYWASGKNASRWGIEGYGNESLWGVLFVDETLQKGYKSWAKALYDRPNPYTGIRLADDPSIALIQVQNEDSLLFWTLEAAKPTLRAKLTKLFNAWLIEKYGSIEAAKTAWSGTALDGDDPSRGKLALAGLYELTIPQTGGKARRIADQTAFLATIERRFYDGMATFYRQDLGCKQLLNGSNWKSASQARLDEPLRWANSGMDVMAVNHYYTGVHNGPNNSWRIDPGDQFTQRSGLVDPRALPFNLRQVVGRPMVVTESTWVSPLAFQSEGPFLTSVYMSLTGVDAFYWFQADQPTYFLDPFFSFAKVNGQSPLVKWSASIPPIMGNFPAAALLFRRGYVKQGAPVVHEERSLQSLWDREVPLIVEDPSFDPNRDTGNRAVRPDGVARAIDPLAFLVGPVEVVYEGDPKKTRVADLSKWIDRDSKIVRSNTGEITLDHGKGLCTVNAPKAQGACGFLAKAGMIRLTDLSINSANAYASILAVSFDDQPLATSKAVLIQVGTAARPTGWETKDVEIALDPKTKARGFQIVKTGKTPWMIADTEVGLALRNTNLTRATLLDTAGFEVEDVPVRRVKTGISLTLPPDSMYVLLR